MSCPSIPRWIVAATMVLSGVTPAAAAAESSFLDNGVTAHRGYSAKHPENTLRAFQAALAAGADWLECDIFCTRDGQLVVIHDATTGRVGDRDLRVRVSTYDELIRVDVAYKFRAKQKLTVEQCPVERMPLLSELLSLVMKQQRTRLSIQPKDDSTAKACQLVEQMGAARWVGFNDADLAKMILVKKLQPNIRVFWDRPSDKVPDDDVSLAQKYGFETVVLKAGNVGQVQIERLHRAHLKAGVWIVNDAVEMRRLLGLGIDRIYTDDPALLLQSK